MLRDTLENFEVCRESLPCAARVVDDDRHTTASRQGKGHGHPMVIVSVDSDAALDLRIAGDM